MTEGTARIYQTVRESGGRLTVPTRILIDVLTNNAAHLTAEDLNAEIERRASGIAPSTIYRLLQRLGDLGVVEHVHSGNGPAFYHLRESGHAHLVCNDCGTVIDIPDTLLHNLAHTIDDMYDFTIEPHHSALLGHCANCRPGTTPTQPAAQEQRPAVDDQPAKPRAASRNASPHSKRSPGMHSPTRSVLGARGRAR